MEPWPPAGIEWYYHDNQTAIAHGDCREIVPRLGPMGLLLADPPYGIGADRNLRANRQGGAALAMSKDYGRHGKWDTRPSQLFLNKLISSCHKSIIWGGNYFSLPPSSCWLVWNKDNGNNTYADCELAWTNLPGAIRYMKWRWMGMLQEYAGRYKEERVHPAQKPYSVMRWCIELSSSTGIILDPYMGSGTILRAAKDLGRKSIGIESHEGDCEIAANQLRQEAFAFPPSPSLSNGVPEQIALFA